MTSPPSRSRRPMNVARDLTTARNSASSVDSPRSSALPSNIGTSAHRPRTAWCVLSATGPPTRAGSTAPPSGRPRSACAEETAAPPGPPAQHSHANPRHSRGWTSATARHASRRAPSHLRSSPTSRPAPLRSPPDTGRRFGLLPGVAADSAFSPPIAPVGALHPSCTHSRPFHRHRGIISCRAAERHAYRRPAVRTGPAFGIDRPLPRSAIVSCVAETRVCPRAGNLGRLSRLSDPG